MFDQLEMLLERQASRAQEVNVNNWFVCQHAPILKRNHGLCQSEDWPYLQAIFLTPFWWSAIHASVVMTRCIFKWKNMVACLRIYIRLWLSLSLHDFIECVINILQKHKHKILFASKMQNAVKIWNTIVLGMLFGGWVCWIQQTSDKYIVWHGWLGCKALNLRWAEHKRIRSLETNVF